MYFIKRFCCAVFLSSLFVSAACAETAVGEFKKIHGIVDVFHAGERKAITVGVGATVKVGDTVRTGRRSRAQLQLADGSILNIGSLTKIQIGEFSFDAEKKIRKSSISDLRGMVRSVVSKSTNKNSFFEIKTPGAVAAVRGTDYGTDVVSPTETVVVTYSGSVGVSNLFGAKKKEVLVKAGQYTRVVGKSPPSKPLKAPAGLKKKMTSGTKQAIDSSSSGDGASTSGSSSNSASAAAAPVNTGGGSAAGSGTSGSTTQTATQANTQTIMQTTAPTIPKIATPPIVLSVPAIQNQNVNIVIQF